MGSHPVGTLVSLVAAAAGLASCSGDQPAGPPPSAVVLQVRNETGAPRYLVVDYGVPTTLSLGAPPLVLLAEGEPLCGHDYHDDPMPRMQRLEAGAVFTFRWNGVAYTRDEAGRCWRRDVRSPGRYPFRLCVFQM